MRSSPRYPGFSTYVPFAVLALFLWSGTGLAQETMLARTPPMGWNSWNHFACGVSDAVVRAQANAMVASGMKIWMKPLEDGSKAVGLFNRGWGAMPVTVNFRDVGLGDSANVRNLWTRKDLGRFQVSYTAQVAQHGVVLIRAK